MPTRLDPNQVTPDQLALILAAIKEIFDHPDGDGTVTIRIVNHHVRKITVGIDLDAFQAEREIAYWQREKLHRKTLQ